MIKPNKKGDSDIQAAIKETSKYSVKSSDYLTRNKEKDTEIVSDLEQGNLIHTNEDEKITEEEEKAYSITAIWNHDIFI